MADVRALRPCYMVADELEVARDEAHRDGHPPCPSPELASSTHSLPSWPVEKSAALHIRAVAVDGWELMAGVAASGPTAAKVEYYLRARPAVHVQRHVRPTRQAHSRARGAPDPSPPLPLARHRPAIVHTAPPPSLRRSATPPLPPPLSSSRPARALPCRAAVSRWREGQVAALAAAEGSGSSDGGREGAGAGGPGPGSPPGPRTVQPPRLSPRGGVVGRGRSRAAVAFPRLPSRRRGR